RRRRCRRRARSRRAGVEVRRAAAGRRAARTPSAGLRRAARPALRRRARPRRRLTLRGGGGLFRGGLLLRRRRRRGRTLRLYGRRALLAGEHALAPRDRVLLGEVLREAQLRGEDLLRLDVHLLLARRKTLLAVAERQVPHDLGELEDVAGLHLVAVVLEAAVPVLRHLSAATRQVLDDFLDRFLVDHLAEADQLAVLGWDVHRHVVVLDANGQVLPLLAEHLALLALHDRPCTVVGIHHL